MIRFRPYRLDACPILDRNKKQDLNRRMHAGYPCESLWLTANEKTIGAPPALTVLSV